MATKQTLFAGLASILLMSLASCSNDELINNEPSAPRKTIGFNVTADRATRATKIYNSTTKPEEFRIGAWYHNDDPDKAYEYIHEDVIKLTGTEYLNATDLRYWPNYENEKLDFFAYQSGDATTSLTFSLTKEDGSLEPKITGFTVEEEATKQQDLIFARKFDVAKPSNGELSLTFNHALAQVAFKAKNDSEHIYIQIEEVALGDISQKGDFYFETSASDNANWRNLNDKKEFKSSFTAVTLDRKEHDATATASELTSDDTHMLMVIPSNYTAAPETGFTSTGSTGSYIRVNCKIWNVANPANGYQNGKDVLIHDGDLYIPYSFDWNMGSKYTYTIVFGKGTAGLSSEGKPTLVTVDIPEPTVNDWTEETGKDVDKWGETGSEKNI